VITAAVSAILEKPSREAVSAMMKKKTDQDNTSTSKCYHYSLLQSNNQFRKYLRA